MAVFCIWGDKPFPELGSPYTIRLFHILLGTIILKKEGIKQCLTSDMSL